MKIYKYKVEMLDMFSVEMPKNAKVIHVALQPIENSVNMWATVEDRSDLIKRFFSVKTTGEEIDAEYLYIGSFMIHGGKFVGHLFEVKQ